MDDGEIHNPGSDQCESQVNTPIHHNTSEQ